MKITTSYLRIGFTILIFFFLHFKAFTQVIQQDFDALVSLYFSTQGSLWTDNTGWSTTNNNVKSEGEAGGWKGITVTGNRVTAIDLENNNLNGYIHPDIGNLTALTSLKLSKNSLEQEIPSEIGILTNLTYLNLTQNQLSGNVPASIGNLTLLSLLNLGNNQLSGDIPVEIGNLIALTELHLFDNQFTGAIPAGVANMSSLNILYIYNNEFSTLPDLSALPLTDFAGLFVYQNRLTFGDLEPNIEHLDADFQYIPQKKSTVPETLLAVSEGDNINLTTNIDGSANHYQWFKDGVAITGITSNADYPINNVQISDAGDYYCVVTNDFFPNLTLTSQTITVNFPPQFESIPVEYAVENNFYQYDVSVTDAEPSDVISISCEDNLGWLSIDDNGDGTARLYGTPTGSHVGFNDVVLKAGDGHSIVEQSFTIIVSQQISNQDFDALKALYKATNGGNWTNQVNGVELWDTTVNNVSNRWKGITVHNGRVISLQLPDNNLTGYLPPEIGNLTQLIDLDLQLNSIGGTIPPEVGNLSQLEMLRLSQNQFTGTIPPEIGNLTELESYLWLFDNQLTGTIPTELSNLTKLQNLSLHKNNLHGEVPDELTALTNLNYLFLQENQFTALPDFSHIDFNNGKFKVGGNRLTFGDLEPNISELSDLSNGEQYVPQAVFSVDYNQKTISGGEPFIISVTTDGNNNRYSWFHEGTQVSNPSPDHKYFKIAEESDEGFYTCHVTNTDVPYLTLESTPIELIYNHPPRFTSYEETDAYEDTEYNYHITADDEDGNPVTISYNIKPDWLSFTDNGDGTALLTGTPMNTDVGIYTVELSVVDGIVTMKRTQRYNLLVHNTNDPPTDIFLSKQNIDENEFPGTPVGTLSTEDEDIINGDTHQYSLVAGAGDEDNGRFIITGSSLKTWTTLNYEVKTSYNVRIETEDSEGVTLEKPFVITVNDVNDPPSYLHLSNSSIEENQPLNTKVGSFSSADEDGDVSFTYELTPISGDKDKDNGKFTISGSDLLTNTTLDYEVKSEYSIYVSVRDPGGASTAKHFIISVENLNDNKPQFTADVYTFNILENQNTSIVGQVEAIDLDSIQPVSYSITDNYGFFIIDATEATLSITDNSALDYERFQQFLIPVHASDGEFTANAMIKINILNINEAPTIDMVENQEIEEDAGQKEIILTGISDGDVGKQTLTFDVQSSNQNLIPNPGIIYTQGSPTATLRYQPTANLYGFSVISLTITDDGGTANGGKNSTVITFTIDVKSMNDAPQITVPQGEFEVNERTIIEIAGISVHDVDLGAHDVKAVLWTQNGKLSLAQDDNLVFLSGDGHSDELISFEASLSALNNAVSTVQYIGNQHFYGNDTVYIQISDFGYVGHGGVQTSLSKIPVFVIQVLPPEITKQPVSHWACIGETVTLTAEAAGTGDLSYQWQRNGQNIDNETTNQLIIDVETLNQAGNYRCLVTNFGGISITETAKINLNPMSIDVETTDIVCHSHSTGQIAITTEGGFGQKQYALNAGEYQNLNVFDKLKAGNYQIAVKDTAGCFVTEQATLSEPQSAVSLELISKTDIKCKGEQNAQIKVLATGGNPTYSYILGDEMKTMPVFSELKAGDYEIVAKDKNNCRARLNVSINEPAQALTLIANAENEKCYNKNGEIQIEISGGTPLYNYSWENKSTSKRFENVSQGTYQIEEHSNQQGVSPGYYSFHLTDANNCSVSKNVYVSKAPKLHIDFVRIEDEVCRNNQSGSFEVEAYDGIRTYSYSIDGENYQQDGVFQNLNAGDYNLYITDTEGICTIEEPVTIHAEYDMPVADFYPRLDAYATAKFLNYSTGATSYHWDFDDGETSTEREPVHIFQETRIYEVTLTVSNDCGTVSVTEDVEIINLAINEPEMHDLFTISPNPAKGIFSLKISPYVGTDKISKLEIVAVTGKIIHSETVTTKYIKNIDVRQQPKGVYFVRVYYKNKILTKKLILQ